MVVAAGSLSEVVTGARTLLANCTAFKTRTSSADATAAAKHIRLDKIFSARDLHHKRPFGLVKITQRGANAVSDGVSVGLSAGGNVLIVFEDNAKYGDNHDESYVDFLNFAGECIDQMEQLSGSGSYLPFYNVDMVLAPVRTPRAEQQDGFDYWVAAFVLEWGDLG